MNLWCRQTKISLKIESYLLMIYGVIAFGHRDRFAWRKIITLSNESKLCVPIWFGTPTSTFSELTIHQSWTQRRTFLFFYINFGFLPKCQLQWITKPNEISTCSSEQIQELLFCFGKFLNKHTMPGPIEARIRKNKHKSYSTVNNRNRSSFITAGRQACIE